MKRVKWTACSSKWTIKAVASNAAERIDAVPDGTLKPASAIAGSSSGTQIAATFHAKREAKRASGRSRTQKKDSSREVAIAPACRHHKANGQPELAAAELVCLKKSLPA